MNLNAKKRKLIGSKVKKLRRQGLLPAVIFGKGSDSVSIEVSLKDFIKIYNKAGETEIIDLVIEKKVSPKSVLIKELQTDPVSDLPIHVGFQEIDLTKVVRVAVPVTFTGEEDHPMIKNGKAILITLFSEVEVEALPKDIPHEISIPIKSLKEIEDVLTIEDLKNQTDPNKVNVLVEDSEAVIAKLDYAEMLEVEEEERDVEDIEITAQGDSENVEDGEEKTEEDGSENREKPNQ